RRSSTSSTVGPCSTTRNARSNRTGPTTRSTPASGPPTASTTAGRCGPTEGGPTFAGRRSKGAPMAEPQPTKPEDVGVPEEIPDLGQIEGARLLGNDARERLHADGFDDAEIDAWAETYLAEVGSGTVDQFVEWIARQERRDHKA